MSSATHFRDLSGRLALITGCTGGIGKASALALAGNGCNIAAAAFQADLSTSEGVRNLHTEVVAKLGHADILFNNSGVTGPRIGPQGNIQDISPETFEQTWRTNVGTHFLLTQLCLPHMEAQRYGRIIFNSSVAAVTGGVIGPHYASSKSAMHGLVHWLASRYAKEGITCNAVAPALIAETAMMSNPTEEVKRLIPVGRPGQPAEVAAIVELLATNAYMNNKIVPVDGGMTASAF